jgi:hypothetical protein
MRSFEDLFEDFLQANTSKLICNLFENIIKLLNIDAQNVFENFNTFILNNNQQQHQLPNTRLIYQIIKSKTNYWKANELWKKYDKRASLKDYLLLSRKQSSNNKNKDLNVLIIGCGPVGLRLSIECALLGLRCTVIEKRDQFSRNNVLHLWPYTVIDLKNLGAKLFYGKFCTGSIDHISIRKLQCILLKAALLFGVQVFFNTSFQELIEPTGFESSTTGWRVRLLPECHPLENKTFDVVIGADGQRNTLPGFNYKEFRGRLAIGITANFINYNSDQEAAVQERSGVACIFDQKFFLDLRHETKIDLENIVYYKDDTHYFVMTAKRKSLIEKGVIKQDLCAAKLLSNENINFEALCDYAKLAAYESTNHKFKTLDFAKSHYGKPDVAIFDYASLFHSANASRIIERKGKKIFLSLVGDSLIKPFWPLGSGIARGFLAAFDTAWAIKRLTMNHNELELLCERESIYQLLSHTTQDTVNKNYQEYTIDPTTRYKNLKPKIFSEIQIKYLYDNGTEPLNSFENLMPAESIKNEFIRSKTLLHWSKNVVQPYGIRIEDFNKSWKDGLAFCAIIHRFRSELIDYTTLNETTSNKNISLLFDVMETKLGLSTNFNKEDLIKNGISLEIISMILEKLYNVFKNNTMNGNKIYLFNLKLN